MIKTRSSFDQARQMIPRATNGKSMKKMCRPDSLAMIWVWKKCCNRDKSPTGSVFTRSGL